MRQTFSRNERLSGKKKFEDLVKKGNRLFSFPFRVIWMETQEEMPFPANVAFAVSKRNFKRAVDRNYIKRICREGYRKNKAILYEPLSANGKKLLVLFVFLHNSRITARECEAKIVLTLRKLTKETDAERDHKKT